MPAMRMTLDFRRNSAHIALASRGVQDYCQLMQNCNALCSYFVVHFWPFYGCFIEASGGRWNWKVYLSAYHLRPATLQNTNTPYPYEIPSISDTWYYRMPCLAATTTVTGTDQQLSPQEPCKLGMID